MLTGMPCLCRRAGIILTGTPCLCKEGRYYTYRQAMPMQEGRYYAYKHAMSMQDGMYNTYRHAMSMQEGRVSMYSVGGGQLWCAVVRVREKVGSVVRDGLGPSFCGHSLRDLEHDGQSKQQQRQLILVDIPKLPIYYNVY